MQFFDDNGDPLAGGKLYTYTAGTTTPKATYTDAGGATPNANPVILDSAGRAVIFIDGSYKFRLETAASVLVREVDNVSAFTTSAVTIDSILPNQSGNAGKFLTTNGATSSWGTVTAGGPTFGAPINTTSGTAIDITGIASTARQIIISFDNVNNSASDNFLLQIGDSGGIETTGANGVYCAIAGGAVTTPNFYGSAIVAVDRNGTAVSGNIILSLVDTATNSWSGTAVMAAGSSRISVSTGNKALSSTLDRIRLTTVGGTGTFSNGIINIQYQ